MLDQFMQDKRTFYLIEGFSQLFIEIEKSDDIRRKRFEGEPQAKLIPQHSRPVPALIMLIGNFLKQFEDNFGVFKKIMYEEEKE